MSMPKQPISVLVVIHTRHHDVLLLERSAHPGYWQSVTGSREGEERLADTARREVFEETGINATTGTLTDWQISNRYEIFLEWRHRYAPGITHNLEYVFGLELPTRIDPVLAPDEHRDSVWLPWHEAAEKCFSWSNRDAILLLPDHAQPRS